jgi:protein-S-isoprenylcysteine O-methyltransferase Ste14
VIALIVILGMLVTAIVVLDKSSKVKVSVTELIGLRIGFSIYAGWLTTATILNVMFVLKSFGLYADPLEKEAETKFGVAVLCFAECLFIGLSLWLRNPLYAAVWLWAMGAIRNNNKEYENIQTTCLVLLIIHGVYVLGLTAWLVLKKVKKEESKGLFC